MASRALPLLLMGGAAALLIAKGREEPETDPDSAGEPDSGSEPDSGPGSEPDPGPGSEPDPGPGSEPDPGNGGGDGDPPPPAPYAGAEGGQLGDARWDIRELSNGDWEWRAWRWTVGFSQSGWKNIGVTPGRSSALILAKKAAADLGELDGDRLKAVEEEMVSLQNYPSASGSPYNNYPPLKRVFIERRIGPNVSYGISIYEDNLTRQDGRYIGYMVIPEAGSQTIRRTKSEAQVADGGKRINDLYNLLMLVVDQYW